MTDSRPLFVSRPVENMEAIRAWARAQGLSSLVADLHVTVAWSRSPVDWFQFPRTSDQVVISVGGPRDVVRMGEDQDSVVLLIRSPELTRRWQMFLDGGASWDWDEYRPHITLTLSQPDLDVDNLEPYEGVLVLGPEQFRDPRPNDAVLKVDNDKRLVTGWFSVIEEDGQTVFDTQGDGMTADDLVETAHNFVLDARAGKVMHRGRRVADVVDSIVFTKDIQAVLGIDLGRVGWFGTMKVRDDGVWADVKSGKFKGFSVGGSGLRIPLEG